MNASRTERASVWCGIAFVAIFGIGFAIAGFIPPPLPGTSASALARDFAEHRDRIRAGLQIAWPAGVLFLPWVAVMSNALRRIEGRQSSVMAQVQFAAGIGSALLFVIPLLQLQAAVFRPDRPVAIVQAIQDIVWLPFVGVWALPAMQSIAIAVTILLDPRPVPLLPRWAAYFNIWVALAYVPAIGVPFFRHGPLTWSGLLPWWLGAAAFFSWIVVMSVLMLRRRIGEAGQLPDEDAAVPAQPRHAEVA